MPKGPKIVQETDKKVSAVCQKALSKVQEAVLHHYQAHPDSAWSGHYLVDLEKTITEIYKDMGVDIGGLFKIGLSKQMQDFYDKAAKDMIKMGKRNAILGKPDVGLVKQYLNSSYEEIAMRTTKMTFEHKRALRSMAGDVLKTSSLTGASMAEVTREFLARAQEIPGFKFTDAGGATWSNETYFRMLARTEMMNAGRASYDAKCAKEGVDLVELSVSGNCCDACAEYEGTVFSLTGATPGYPTKQDLIDAGVFHPNCTHSYFAVANWNLPDAEDEGEQKQEEEPQEMPAPAQKPAPEPEPVKQPEPEPAPVVVPQEVTPPPVDAEQADAEQQAEEAKKSKQLTQTALDDIKKKYEATMAEYEKQLRAAEEAERKARDEEERLKQAEEELRKKAEEEKKAEENAKKVAKKKEAGFPESIDGLRHIDYLGGSTGAELVEDANGNRFVMKRGASADHVRNELAVDNFYRAAGINVPEGKIIETPDGPVKLSRYIDETKSLGKWWETATKAERKEMLEKLRAGFDVDVLAGNWDVVGMSRDNILIDKNGNPWRVDNGGGFGFRAQGARKADSAWKEGWPDEIWSMRTSDYNKAFFGDIKTLDLLNSIADRKWSKAINGLSDEDKKVVKKRLAEIKELAVRGNDFKDNARYTDNAVETILKSSYDYSKGGLREKIPNIKEPDFGNIPDKYGWFRTGKLSPTAIYHRDINEDIKTTFDRAQNEIKNYNTVFDRTLLHVNGAKDWLEKEANSGNENARYYLEQIDRINKAKIDGKPLDPPIYTDVYVKTTQDISEHKSFTGYVFDCIRGGSIEYNGKTIPLSSDFIQRGQSSQSGNSFGYESCKVKMARLNAQGIDLDKADKKYFTGATSDQIDNWNMAKEYYKAHPEALARDTETYLRYQSAICVALENSKFENNDPKTRTVILGRTEDNDVMAKSKVGHEMNAKHGVNESHGVFQTVVVEGDNLTIARVPYSRISGVYFAEPYPGANDAGFHSNSENEFTADTSGLKVMFVKAHVYSGQSLQKYDYIKDFLEWEKNKYP